MSPTEAIPSISVPPYYIVYDFSSPIRNWLSENGFDDGYDGNSIFYVKRFENCFVRIWAIREDGSFSISVQNKKRGRVKFESDYEDMTEAIGNLCKIIAAVRKERSEK